MEIGQLIIQLGLIVKKSLKFCRITKRFVRLQGNAKILTEGIHEVFRGLKKFFNTANGQTTQLYDKI